MIYLDTHIVVWLYGNAIELFSDKALDFMRKHQLFISPMVYIELQYLYESKKIAVTPPQIMSDLSTRLELQICEKSFSLVAEQANLISWTRDPFDRIIVAHAAVQQNMLISKDRTIVKFYPHAIW